MNNLATTLDNILGVLTLILLTLGALLVVSIAGVILLAINVYRNWKNGKIIQASVAPLRTRGHFNHDQP